MHGGGYSLNLLTTFFLMRSFYPVTFPVLPLVSFPSTGGTAPEYSEASITMRGMTTFPSGSLFPSKGTFPLVDSSLLRE